MKSRNKTQKHLLKMYESHASLLAIEFASKYFGKDFDFYWIGKEIGVAEINGRFFNMNDMYEAMRYKLTRAQLFAWYDDNLTEKNERLKISLRNWRFIDVGGKDTKKR